MTDRTQLGEEVAHESFEAIADNMASIFLVIVANNALKAAGSEEYRDRLQRRSELRKELSSPEWVPDWIDPYYNIVDWKGRLAFFIGELHLQSPVRWYGRPGLERLIRWSMDVDVTTRWEAHDDWPC